MALLPLPLLVWRFAPPALAAEEAALWVPQLSRFSLARNQLSRTNRSRAAKFVALLCWLLLICACARPQWLGDPLDLPVSGRDLLLAVDISGSMKMPDFEIGGKQVERLTALKQLAIPFIERRSGDRIGLLLFADQAYVQTPLTFDLESVQTLLGEAMIGMAGQQTAIGDAIGLTLKRTQQDEATSRVLILMTDGANTAGELTPLKAAELAASAGLKIYTIGIGAEEMEVGGFLFSQKVNPSQDLDETTLKAIAEQTGGRYFRAHDTEELEQIYALLDELEPAEKDVERYRPVSEMFFWPLGLALCAAALLAAAELIGPLRRRK
jgi:Ca-activated chloride channel family protein